MGNMQNCSSSQHYDFGDFNPATYFKPGVTINEIVGVKTIFESLKPQDGVVKVEKIQELYKSSYDKPKIDEKFGSRKYVNFEEFYEVMSQMIKLIRKKNLRILNLTLGKNQCLFV